MNKKDALEGKTLVMDKIGALIARFPAFALALILVISAVMIGFAIKLDFNTTEEDFNPDSDIARANYEVMDQYGVRAHYVEVVVTAKYGDVLTSECMLDMLGTSENVSSHSLVGPALLRSTASPTGSTSIADIVLLLYDMFNSVEQVKAGLDMMREGLRNGSEGMDSFAFFLSAAVNSENVLDMGPQIKNLSEEFTQASGPSEFPVDDRTSHEKMSGICTEDIKTILFDTLNFNKSLQARPVVATADSVLSEAKNLTNATTNLVKCIEDVKSYPNSTKTIPGTDTTVADVLTLLEGYLAFLIAPDPQALVQTAFLIFDVIEEAGPGIAKLLSKDFRPDAPESRLLHARSAMMLVQLNSSLEDLYPGRMLECEKAISDIAKDDRASTDMRTIGYYMISDEISGNTASEMVFLIAIALVLLLVILAITYRSVLDMAVSFVGICLAVCWTLGFAVILDYDFNTIMIAAPILVIGMGIDYGIHTTLRYKEETRKDPGQFKKAVTIAIGSVGTALVLATVTTCAGFISNLSSELELIRRFSILCVIGVLSSFVVLCVLVSSTKLLIDQMRQRMGYGKAKGPKGIGRLRSEPSRDLPDSARETKRSLIVRFSGLGATFAKRSSWAVIIITLLITGISLLGALRLDTTFEFEDFLPRGSEISDNFRYAQAHFDLSTDESYILMEGDVATPEVLVAMDSTLENMKDDKYVDPGSAFCVLTLMRDVADDQRAARPLDHYNATFASLYAQSCTPGSDIPSQNVTELFSWLYFDPTTHDTALKAIRLKDGASRGAPDFDGALVTVGVTTNKVESGDEIQDELQDDKEPIQELVDRGDLDKAVVTGGLVVSKVTMEAMTRSQTMSIVITVIVSIITLSAIFFYKRRSFVLGAITTVPIAFVIAWVLGGMFLLGYKLNMLTITIGSLTVGIGVTYAIHVTHRFLEDLETERDIDKALDKCLAHTGMAVFGSAATTVGGFAVLLFSSLPPMQQFGGITAMAITFAMISAIFVLPSMLRIWANVLEDRGRLFRDGKEAGTGEAKEENAKKKR